MEYRNKYVYSDNREVFKCLIIRDNDLRKEDTYD